MIFQIVLIKNIEIILKPKQPTPETNFLGIVMGFNDSFINWMESYGGKNHVFLNDLPDDDFFVVVILFWKTSEEGKKRKDSFWVAYHSRMWLRSLLGSRWWWVNVKMMKWAWQDSEAVRCHPEKTCYPKCPSLTSSIPGKLIRHAASQAPPQFHWIGICIEQCSWLILRHIRV